MSWGKAVGGVARSAAAGRGEDFCLGVTEILESEATAKKPSADPSLCEVRSRLPEHQLSHPCPGWHGCWPQHQTSTGREQGVVQDLGQAVPG